MGKKKPRGSVVVVGGGIAGIQAALSLGNAGYGVYLVERKANLGGQLPDLHRFYPLCACCKVDPKIAACELHPNIQVLPSTSVEEITGKLGSFRAALATGSDRKTVDAGAVILAAGLETFEPTQYETYSYGHLPNVVTSLEYEQMQKPTGPQQGVIRRPSDGKTPQSVAWLQCVGSRDINQCDAPYCSSVCCMYALKEALHTKEMDDEITTTIFFMDMRTHGKGYENYLNQAVDRGVRLVRSRVHTIEAVPGTDDLSLLYADESGHLQREVFGMAVLSVGLRPAGDGMALAQQLGVHINGNGYAATLPFQPASTHTPGVFVCGGLAGPHDIHQSLAQASAAVSGIQAVLEPEPFSDPLAYPVPSNAEGEPPKILFAYHLCPTMESSLAKAVEAHAGKIPDILATIRVDGDMVSTLAEQLRKAGANRLVFASCSPLVHKKPLEEALRRAGLNPYLYEMVDLRLLDSNLDSAQLQDRIRTGAVRASFLEARPVTTVPVVQRALVVGGGISGMESALAVAHAGYDVTLVERQSRLGGHGNHVRKTWNGNDVQGYLEELTASVEKDPRISVMLETEVKRSRGVPGSFVTTVTRQGKEVDVAHGATILATGGDTVPTQEYLYGRHPGVYTWEELSRKMLEDPSAFDSADSAVFIQCVGSREPRRPHCSNFCCSFTLRTALDLKNANPDMDIYILYREMRAFGERENLYREAREQGIVFIRYDVDNKPIAEPAAGGKGLTLTVYEPVLQKSIVLKPDFISLQTAIVPAGNRELADIFKIQTDRDGFFADSPQKLRPLDSAIEGVYLAGMALYPKDSTESIVQARGAAARALEILSRDTVEVGGITAEVLPERCAVCCTCVRTCPFGVPFIDAGVGAAYIDPSLCQGCGMCVAECPAKAIVMSNCSDDMLTGMPSVLLRAASET